MKGSRVLILAILLGSLVSLAWLAFAAEVDTDADQLPDSWEVRYFGDLSKGRDGDSDGEGVTNFIEYTLGTNPIDAHDRPSPGITSEYDDLGRVTRIFLLNETTKNNYEIEYQYDNKGNRTKRVVHTTPSSQPPPPPGGIKIGP